MVSDFFWFWFYDTQYIKTVYLMFWGVLYFWADTDGFDLFDLALFDAHISPFQCVFFPFFPTVSL